MKGRLRAFEFIPEVVGKLQRGGQRRGILWLHMASLVNEDVPGGTRTLRIFGKN